MALAAGCGRHTASPARGRRVRPVAESSPAAPGATRAGTAGHLPQEARPMPQAPIRPAITRRGAQIAAAFALLLLAASAAYGSARQAAPAAVVKGGPPPGAGADARPPQGDAAPAP